MTDDDFKATLELHATQAGLEADHLYAHRRDRVLSPVRRSGGTLAWRDDIIPRYNAAVTRVRVSDPTDATGPSSRARNQRLRVALTSQPHGLRPAMARTVAEHSVVGSVDAGKRWRIVFNRTMAYVEAGTGDPIVLLHGNPTSSYLWRNVLPHLDGLDGVSRRPDWYGRFDKLPNLVRLPIRSSSTGAIWTRCWINSASASG